MSVYHSSFNYLGINSRLKNLVVAHFDADQGEQETFLNLEPIYTDSALGLRRYDYGAKYSSVATFRLNVIKSDNSDFTVAEVRSCLKWLTGTTTNSTLDLLIGENIQVSFIGRITNVWQYKMDARTVGLILEFTSASPFAYSPKQTIVRSISGTETLQIYCPSDDLYSSVYLQTKYTNTSGDSLVIDNTTTGEITEVTELTSNEIVTIDGDLMIVSDKPNKIFGDTFNFVFPRLISGINNFTITANGDITFEYSYPIKIGDLTIDIEELSAAIDCESNPGPGTVITEYTTWENILNKPTTVDGYGITDVYTMSETDGLLSEKATNEQLAEVVNRVEINENNIVALQNTKADQTEIDTLKETKADVATTLAGYGITDAYTKTEVDAKVTSVYKYMGSVQDESLLPTENLVVGYVYNLEDSGMNMAWNGTEWDALGSTIDLTSYLTKDEALSLYPTKDEVDQKIANVQPNNTYTKDEIDDKFNNLEIKDLSWNNITDKPTTIEGYGITDAYNKDEVDALLSSVEINIDEEKLNEMLTEILI